MIIKSSLFSINQIKINQNLSSIFSILIIETFKKKPYTLSKYLTKNLSLPPSKLESTINLILTIIMNPVEL